MYVVKTMIKNGLCLWGLLSLLTLEAPAQKTNINNELNSSLKKAEAFQNEQNYSMAYIEYNSLVNRYESIAPQKQSRERDGLEVSEIYFNRALCAYYLMNNDVDMLFKEYKTLFPNSLKSNRADFYIANWYSQKGEFLLALNTYQNMDTSSLGVSERYEYNYKLGYCYFLQNLNEKAKIHFARVKDAGSKYSDVSKYYYGHILYSEGKYDLALNEFEPLRNNKHFSKVVPYYICQIYYFEENYEALVEMAPALSQNAINSKRAIELNRMLGDAYYKLGQYENAIPYIKQSIASSEAVNRNDNYLMGYCLMETGRFGEATDYFNVCTHDQDPMAQNASYSLGYCYLTTGDSVAALNSYKLASNMDFDKQIEEDALFCYAKLSIINSNPYNEALVAQLIAYLKENGSEGTSSNGNESSRVNEARICLAQIYEKTRNYSGALEQMDKIRNRDEQINKIYVKICLNRGVELYNNAQYAECIGVLDRIDQNISACSNDILACSKYIKAEAFYESGDYNKTEQILRSYYSVPDNDNNRYKLKADYLMAYCLFKQKKYPLAKDYYKRVSDRGSEDYSDLGNDADIRIADCEYMMKNYEGAIKSYSRYLAYNGPASDYATYQKAMAEGASGKFSDKIATLQTGINNYPNSSYIPAMTYETANTYLAINENDEALATYEHLLKTYPDNTFTKDCLGKVGMLYYQDGQNEKALTYLDKLIQNYPNTKQAQAALSTVKKIYIDKGMPEEYISYANRVGNTKVSESEEEDLLYQSAENRYMDEKYHDAVTMFESYLSSFPNGTNSVKAEYYLADCLIREKDSSRAAEYYYKVAIRPYCQYTEKALVLSAELYSQRDSKKALDIYSRLDNITSSATNKTIARQAMMNIYYQEKDYSKAIEAAGRLLELENSDNGATDNANFVMAESYRAKERKNDAKEYIDRLSTSSNKKYFSYAKYCTAESLYDEGKYDQSEQIIRKMSKDDADEYYLAKAFILWSDIFVKRGNDFQAKQTLQSIMENYDGKDDILQTAADKLATLQNKNEQQKQENEEKLQNQESSVDEIVIEDNKF